MTFRRDREASHKRCLVSSEMNEEGPELKKAPPLISRTGTMAMVTQRPRKQLFRATTDLGPRQASPSRPSSDEEDWELRHGWEEQYNSEEYLTILNSVSILT